MSDIFLSYKSEDKPKAQIIATALEQEGHSVWWDRVIPAGRSFDEVIREELESAKCVLVLWSKKSVLSDWVKEEADKGKNRKILIPILVDEVEIPMGFGRIQSVRLVDWQGTLPNPDFDLLLKSVEEILDTQKTEKTNEKVIFKESKLLFFGGILLFFRLLFYYINIYDTVATGQELIILNFMISNEVGLVLVAALSGALGGLVHSLLSFYRHPKKAGLFTRGWVRMLFMPFVGSAFGIVSCLVIRGWFISPFATVEQTNVFGFATFAALVGLFSERIVLKLKMIKIGNYLSYF